MSMKAGGWRAHWEFLPYCPKDPRNATGWKQNSLKSQNLTQIMFSLVVSPP